jgi:hypothetical protein
MLTFAAAVAEAEAMLEQQANGFDLTPLYPKLPAALNASTSPSSRTATRTTSCWRR